MSLVTRIRDLVGQKDHCVDLEVAMQECENSRVFMEADVLMALRTPEYQDKAIVVGDRVFWDGGSKLESRSVVVLDEPQPISEQTIDAIMSADWQPIVTIE